MCSTCEAQFSIIAEEFDEWLAHCRTASTQPRPSQPTKAEKVHDRAVVIADGGKTSLGNWINAWYLALAVERLLALESAGIPT
jgi:hypothetical protein